MLGNLVDTNEAGASRKTFFFRDSQTPVIYISQIFSTAALRSVKRSIALRSGQRSIAPRQRFAFKIPTTMRKRCLAKAEREAVWNGLFTNRFWKSRLLYEKDVCADLYSDWEPQRFAFKTPTAMLKRCVAKTDREAVWNGLFTNRFSKSRLLYENDVCADLDSDLG